MQIIIIIYFLYYVKYVLKNSKLINHLLNSILDSLIISNYTFLIAVYTAFTERALFFRATIWTLAEILRPNYHLHVTRREAIVTKETVRSATHGDEGSEKKFGIAYATLWWESPARLQTSSGNEREVLSRWTRYRNNEYLLSSISTTRYVKS